MTWLDWTIIGLYFAGIAGIAIWCSKRLKNTADYFLAGRNAGFFLIGASIFSSNIGSEHVVGLAGSGAQTGLAMAHWELHAWVLVLLAYLFVPFYYKSGVYTIPEYLERRFSSKTRWILSIVSLVAYVFTKVSVTVYAGALVFGALLPDTFGSPEAAFWIGAFLTVILTGIYTITGGMRAVMYTEAPQAMIMVFGSFLVTYFGLHQLGGWSELIATAKPHAEEFALWRPLSDASGLPWLGVIIASPIIGIWYWCTDQYIVQRTLTAKNLKEARKGALMGGLLKVTPVLIFLIPGLIGWALYQKGLLPIPNKLGTSTADFDMVFPTLVTHLLPSGVRGLIVACLLAALMSSLASLFNSSASLFTVDIYEKLRPGRSQAHYVWVGRTATAVVVGLGMLWIPVMKLVNSEGLYQYLQNVQGFLAPPICALFILGLFWKRINAYGATWGLSLGFVLGMGKLCIQTFYGTTPGKLADPAWLAAIGDFNWLYATGVLFVISCIIIIVASFLTPPPPEEKTHGLTYSSVAHDEDVKSSWDRGNTILACVVLGLVACMYLYFSFWLC